jgi:putative beta-barrel porin BBP2
MRRVLAGIGLVLLCASGRAFPDTTLEQEFPVEGMFHWGPIRARPFLLLKDTGYDDNVYLDDTNPQGDFTSTGEAGIRFIAFFSDRAAVAAEERLDYVWFAQNTSQNHFNNAFRGAAHFYFKKLTLFTDLDTLNLKERPSTAEFDFRIRRIERRLGGGVTYERSRSSLQMRIGRDRYHYISDTPEGQYVPDHEDRVENRLTLTARQKLLPKTSVLLEWEARGITFTHEAGQVGNSQARRISTGVEFDPSAFLKGSLKIGVENLRPEREQFTPYHGLVGEGVLIYRVTNRTNLEGRGRKYTGFTSVPDNVYYIYDGYGATLTQFLAARVAGEIGADREQVEYPEVTQQVDPDHPLTPVTGLRTDRFKSYFVGISYRFNNQARMGLRVGQWRRITDPPFDFLNRTRNTAMVTYSYNF